MLDYANNPAFFKPVFWHWMILMYCAVYNTWDKQYYGFGTDKLYCYDNVFADVDLHNGDGEATGIYQWYDVYTPLGWLETYMFYMLYVLMTTYVRDGLYSVIFTLFYLANDDMVWCFPGEDI